MAALHEAAITKGLESPRDPRQQLGSTMQHRMENRLKFANSVTQSCGKKRCVDSMTNPLPTLTFAGTPFASHGRYESTRKSYDLLATFRNPLTQPRDACYTACRRTFLRTCTFSLHHTRPNRDTRGRPEKPWSNPTTSSTNCMVPTGYKYS